MSFTRNELIELYNNNHLSTRQIAKTNGVTRATVVYHMKKFYISRREGNQPKPFTYDELYDLYVTKRMSTHQIAKLKGCAHATIRMCLMRNEIKLRDKNHKGRKVNVTNKVRESMKKALMKRWFYLKANPFFTEEHLRKLYVDDGLSTREIAKMKNTTHRRVLSWMDKYNIHRRSLSEANKKHILLHPKRLQQMILALRKGSKHPNKAEENLLRFLVKQKFPFRYVGNGSFSIGGLCPDFVATDNSKRLIEFFGDYWHKPEEEEKRKKAFAKFGFDTLIIWEHEMKNETAVLNKIESWMVN